MNDKKHIKHQVKYHNKIRSDVEKYYPGIEFKKPGFIETHDDDYYKLPYYAESIMGKSLNNEIKYILMLIKDINNEFVNESVVETGVLLSDDLRVFIIRSKLQVWIGKYCKERLKKTNLKDKDCPVAKFTRIYNELYPFFYRIMSDENSIDYIFMSDCIETIPWRLYVNTWKKLISIETSENGLTLSSNILPENKLKICGKYFEKYHWRNEDDCKEFFDLMFKAVSMDENLLKRTTDKKQLDLLNMASDIQEMKPFLIRNYNPEKSIIKFENNVFIGWEWGSGHTIGVIMVDFSKRELLEAFHNHLYKYQIGLEYDGILTNFILPWFNTKTMPFAYGDDLPYYDLNIIIVSEVHKILFSFYEQIDVEGILNKSQSADDNHKTELSEELVAASCQVIADDEEIDEAPTKFGKKLIPKVRSQRLFSILENRLDCEIRTGKGSEIIIYRKSGKIFRLGHHKQNEYIPSVIIKNLLNRINVTKEEWMLAIGY